MNLLIRTIKLLIYGAALIAASAFPLVWSSERNANYRLSERSVSPLTMPYVHADAPSGSGGDGGGGDGSGEGGGEGGGSGEGGGDCGE